MSLWIADANSWLAFSTLIILEIILGIDNIIFISLVVENLPKNQQNKARRIGMIGAMLTRLSLLTSMTWIIKLTHPLFILLDHSFSIRDLILLSGGLFLLWKSSIEIYESIERNNKVHIVQAHSFIGTIIQILMLDIIFSIDSVITAVGLSDHLFIMMAAVIIAVIIMTFAAKSIGEFVSHNPSVKMLALSFLVLIGFTLILESFCIHLSKGYIYFAMFFSIAVEYLNLMRNNKIQ